MIGRAKLSASPAPGVTIPAPATPTLIRPLPQTPLQFENLAALARHIHRARTDRAGAPWGLQLGPISHASYAGSVTFPGFNLHLVDPGTDDLTWVGFVAVQSHSSQGLQDALRKAEPEAADLAQAAA